MTNSSGKTQQQKQKATAPKQVTQTQSDTNAFAQCPNCHAELPDDALFCPECATPLKQLICPNCGRANSLNADICDFCKVWMLEGNCKFCYAELDPDSSFCPECGKPQDGLTCPNCGHKDIFDFCSKCGKPVTPEAITETLAKQASEKIEKPQEAKITAELAELEAIINTPPPPIDMENTDDVYDPDAYDTDEPASVPMETERKSLLSNAIMDSIRQTGSDIDSAVQQRIEAQRIEEEKRKEAARIAEAKRIEALKKIEEKRRQDEAKRIADEQERQRQIKEAQDKRAALLKKQEQDRITAIIEQKNIAIQTAKKNKNKTFRNNHAARKFHFENHHPDAIGWECNAYGTIHLYSEGGPNDCSRPSDGGCDFFGKMSDLYKDEYDLWQRKDKK